MLILMRDSPECLDLKDNNFLYHQTPKPQLITNMEEDNSEKEASYQNKKDESLEKNNIDASISSEVDWVAHNANSQDLSLGSKEHEIFTLNQYSNIDSKTWRKLSHLEKMVFWS